MSYKSDKKAEKEQADNKDAAQNSCVVCFKQTEIFSIGECDHVVCYECSARLRVLLKQKDCMICRAELSQVIFTTEIKPFIKLTAMNRSGLYDTKYRICFTSLRAQTAFYKLLENPCSVCDVPPFPTFGALKDHMRKEHELFYCDICTDNLTVFSFERKCYNRVNLGLHRRRGDPDNTSHKGHPMCEFCDRRYLDRDELFRHLRREHYYCHFCDADGLNHYYADYDALKKHFQSNHFLCEEEACAEEKFTSVFRTEIDLRAHIASTHSRSIGKLATKQARTLEVEFTLAPRNRMGESSRGSNRNNNPAEEEVNYYETSSIVQHAPRPIDAQNEQEFPSLGGSSSSAITVRPSVSIRAKTYGPGGLARTKENFPALGGSSSDVSPIHKNSNNSNGYNALFKNGSSASNSTNSGKVMIHLSNRPATSNATAKKPEVNPKSARDFPSLGKKANLESDFVPLVPVNNSSVSAKHRSIVNQTYESAASGVTATKVGVVPRESVSVPSTSKSAANVPKLNLKDNFPALGNGTDAMASASWITAKKPVTESRKSKVAPPPLSTAATSTKVDSKPNSAASKPEVKSNGKVNNKKDKVKPKVNEKKEEPKVPEKKVEPKGKVNKKTESKPLAKSDSDESECVPSQSVLNVVSSKHRNLINGYDPAIQTNTSKLQFVKRESDTPSEKSTKATVPAFSSTNNFPSLGANDTKFRENNNNNMAISFIDIMKNAKDPVSEADSSKTAPPPGFDKSRKKPTQPPPGFNSVTLNSVVKPTNNLTFTSSLGESYSILPTHHYLPPKNSTKRNKALFAHFQENEDPETVEQFKEISKMFISGSYHALPYYEHCKFALKDKFDVIFPELLVLLPDISKQQELYLVHSQQLQASGNKNKKPTKKNQNLSLEVCATCKQVLIASDLSTHLQSHSLENNFPKLGNQDALSSASAWNK